MSALTIKMKTTAAGPDFAASKGQVVTIPEKRAVDLVEKGFAVYHDLPKEVEAEEVKEEKPARRGRPKKAVAPQGNRIADEEE